MSNGRYLVTGGAGFIGSHICGALLEAGHQVVVLDNLSSGRRENLEDLRAPEDCLELIEGSLLDDGALRRAVAGTAAVFHQAAIPSVPRSFADPSASLRTNVEGTAALLEACREERVRRIVFASSSSVYGDTPTLPKEESMAPSPLSPYALSKLAGEHLCHIYARVYGLEIVALRYFNVFGPRQDPESQYAAVVPRFVSRLMDADPPVIYGDGEQSRDFTFVENVVVANFLAAGLVPAEISGRRGATGNGAVVVNVGVGERYTVLDLVAALNRILGTDLEPEHTDPRPGDVRHSHGSIERAKEYLGYEPRVGFEEGLRRTVEWFRSR